MKKAIKDLRNIFTAYDMVQKHKPGGFLVNKYKAARDTARFVWVASIRPTVDNFFNETSRTSQEERKKP